MLIGRPFMVAFESPVGPSARSILRTLKTPTIPFSSQYTIRIIHTFQPRNRAPNNGIAFATISATTAPTDDVTRYQAMSRSTSGMLPACHASRELSPTMKNVFQGHIRAGRTRCPGPWTMRYVLEEHLTSPNGPDSASIEDSGARERP